MQQQDIAIIGNVKITPPRPIRELDGMGLEEWHIPKVRDERLDAVKFWLIVLVISVHVLMRKEFADSQSCAVAWNWINIFVMPLFLFISGHYSRKKDWKDF